jgi:Concanavalin A-like lectin/glucanases superfamily/Secretion system C-terminal sorting domain
MKKILLTLASFYLAFNASAQSGAALNFDGVDDKAIGTAPNMQGTDFTIEFWAKKDNTSNQGFFRIGTDGINNGSIGMYMFSNGGLSFPFWGNDLVINQGSGLYMDLLWNHYALTYKLSTNERQVYRNSILIGSDISAGTYTGNTTFQIGQFNGLALTTGNIDEFRIWNVIRTPCEINSFMNCEIPGSAPNLLRNYHFNQGVAGGSNLSVTALTDASGNAATCTLTSMSLTGATSNWVALGGVVSNFTTSAVNVGSTVTNSIICNGNSTTLNGTGANTYVWTGGVTNGIAFSPTATIQYTVTGTVTLTGCTNTAVNTVTVNATPIVSSNSGTICSGNSFTITPSGAITYTYSNGSNVASPTANTNYTVTGTDANGCVSSMGAVSSVTVNALPTVMAITSNTLICSGTPVNLSAMGATTYTWNTGSNLTTISVSPTTTTTYTLMGTDANGCMGSTSITQNVSTCTGILVAEALEATLRLYPNPNNGLFTIELNTNSKVIITNALGQEFMNADFPSGNYNIALNEANGIYFIKVISGNTQTTKRLVINK